MFSVATSDTLSIFEIRSTRDFENQAYEPDSLTQLDMLEYVKGELQGPLPPSLDEYTDAAALFDEIKGGIELDSDNGYYYDSADTTFAGKPESELTDAEQKLSHSYVIIEELLEPQQWAMTYKQRSDAEQVTRAKNESDLVYKNTYEVFKEGLGKDFDPTVNNFELYREDARRRLALHYLLAEDNRALEDTTAIMQEASELSAAKEPQQQPENHGSRPRLRERLQRVRSAVGGASLRGYMLGMEGIQYVAAKAQEHVAARTEATTTTDANRRNQLAATATVATLALGYTAFAAWMNMHGHDTSHLALRSPKAIGPFGAGNHQDLMDQLKSSGVRHGIGSHSAGQMHEFAQAPPHSHTNMQDAIHKAPHVTIRPELHPHVQVQPQALPSFRLEQGGTVWGHADDLFHNHGYDNHYHSVNDLKDEIMRLNHLNSEDATKLPAGVSIKIPNLQR